MKAEKRSWQPPEFVSREQCIKDTEEVLAMVEWMRKFNQSGKRRIEFTGKKSLRMEFTASWGE